MPIFDTYSKRTLGLPDIFTYDKISDKLKNQIYHIWNRFFNQNDISEENARFIRREIYSTILEEEGKKYLYYSDYSYNDPIIEVEQYFDNLQDTEKTLDVIEITFYFIARLNKFLVDQNQYLQIRYSADKAIEDLNYRFKENGVGYYFENGKIIRTDSTYTHSEITKPTLALLINTKFIGANEEYLKAHEHYRHGRNKECLTECLKAFESTMKIICTEKGWTFNPTDTANKLVQICFQNGLVPSFTQNQFSSLQNLLVSGIPPIRNKLGGHGQGQTPQKVDDEMTRYALNLTGTNIIFLVEQSGI
jgi:hypothetical protein